MNELDIDNLERTEALIMALQNNEDSSISLNKEEYEKIKDNFIYDLESQVFFGEVDEMALLK